MWFCWFLAVFSYCISQLHFSAVLYELIEISGSHLGVGLVVGNSAAFASGQTSPCISACFSPNSKMKCCFSAKQTNVKLKAKETPLSFYNASCYSQSDPIIKQVLSESYDQEKSAASLDLLAKLDQGGQVIVFIHPARNILVNKYLPQR